MQMPLWIHGVNENRQIGFRRIDRLINKSGILHRGDIFEGTSQLISMGASIGLRLH
jgi:hypothetical protein